VTIEQAFQEFVNERYVQKYPTQILEEISCAEAIAFAKRWAQLDKELTR
jgi:hypothetical protein